MSTLTHSGFELNSYLSLLKDFQAHHKQTCVQATFKCRPILIFTK